MWEFGTDPEFQEKLDWMAAFVRDECEPLDLLFPHPGDPYDVHNKASRTILEPLRDPVTQLSQQRLVGLAGSHHAHPYVLETTIF